MAYATVSDVQARMTRMLTEDEQTVVSSLLDDAAVIIDAYNADASTDAKELVSIRIVQRAIDTADVPIGATQGSVSGLGYAQSWSMSSGSVGEIYLGKLEKKLLGVGNMIGSYSPIEELVDD